MHWIIRQPETMRSFALPLVAVLVVTALACTEPASDPGPDNPFTGTSFRIEAEGIGVSSRGFEAGARTHWHTHSAQLLFAREGRLRYQVEGQAVHEIGPSETAFLPRGVRHWHGATPDEALTHVSITFPNDAGEPLPIEWMEPVTDVVYAGDPSVPIFVEGMNAPESVLHDPGTDLYLVSNINGAPGDRDDNGFISKVAPDGRVVDLRWIDGADPDVTLHAPKGSAVYADRFYVADLDVVRVFDRQTGEPLDEWPVPDAGFLNDVAVGADGTVYVTDTGIAVTADGLTPTGSDAIYRFDAEGTASVVARGADLQQPNGVIETADGLVMVPVGGNSVFRVGDDGSLSVLAETPQGQLDGVVVEASGSLLVSSFGFNAVYRVTREGEVSEVISDVPQADLGIDVGRSRALIPQLGENRLVIYPLEGR